MKEKLLNNPFLITGYIAPTYFCNRLRETEMIIEALQNGRDLTLISPRRYGKTGLIQHVFHLTKESNPKVKCIYIDLFSTRNLDEFIVLFAENVIKGLTTTKGKAIQNIGNIFKSLRPLISFDPLSGHPQLSVTLDSHSDIKSSLDEVFDYLKQKSQKCYIALDEFQQINNYPEKGVEALLRSYIQFLPNIQFIFSGSIMHTMRDIFLSPKRPFFQSTQMMNLGVIAKNEYFAFAKAHFKQNFKNISVECFDLIYNEFDGHTWYVQAVLNRLYAFQVDIDNKELVFEAIDQLIDENSYYYQELLKAYTEVQQNVIEAIAAEKYVKEINAGHFISKYKLKNASSVNRALTKLLDNEVIYRHKKQYTVYDKLMGIWLRRGGR